MLNPTRGAGIRLGSGALIALAHVLFVFALLHYASPRIDTDSAPADYMMLALIPAPTKPAPQARSAPPSGVVPATRPRRTTTPHVQQAPPESVLVLAMPQASVPDALTEAAPPATGKLDMESLRGAARQVEKERVPTALERLRTSEQMHARDDNKLSRAVNEAKRPDCQTKYSGGTSLNLVMLIPLAIDTITDTGCKW
ncbi:hypothetical protein AB2N08_17070 [Massilia aurea]|uniref:hypothetical protein n=1 Tax=Massilia aurea TaxID=373040 RepID=UPI0034625F72